MIKDVVVNLSLKQRRATATPLAVSVAKLFDAHLTGVAFSYEPAMPVVDMGTAIPKAYLEEARAKAEEQANQAISVFEELARREAVEAESHRIALAPPLAPSRFAQMARRFDLAVLTQSEPNEDTIDDIIAEAVLFQAGRPMLLVPYIQNAPLKLDRVTVCWDGSRAATRALGDAMPFLERAKLVDLVVVEKERPKSEDLPGIDVTRHIARHGIKVDLKRLPLETDVATTILNFVADAGTDMIVMGGYGHSRLREFVLGGVTRDILRQMTVPALMSH